MLKLYDSLVVSVLINNIRKWNVETNRARKEEAWHIQEQVNETEFTQRRSGMKSYTTAQEHPMSATE